MSEADMVKLRLKLVAADLVMEAVDETIERGMLNARSMIADARLNYGEPFAYDFAPAKMLKWADRATEAEPDQGDKEG